MVQAKDTNLGQIILILAHVISFSLKTTVSMGMVLCRRVVQVMQHLERGALFDTITGKTLGPDGTELKEGRVERGRLKFTIILAIGQWLRLLLPGLVMLCIMIILGMGITRLALRCIVALFFFEQKVQVVSMGG